jgi:hypothetical protein
MNIKMGNILFALVIYDRVYSIWIIETHGFHDETTMNVTFAEF